MFFIVNCYAQYQKNKWLFEFDFAFFHFFLFLDQQYIVMASHDKTFKLWEREERWTIVSRASDPYGKWESDENP